MKWVRLGSLGLVNKCRYSTTIHIIVRSRITEALHKAAVQITLIKMKKWLAWYRTFNLANGRFVRFLCLSRGMQIRLKAADYAYTVTLQGGPAFVLYEVTGSGSVGDGPILLDIMPNLMNGSRLVSGCITPRLLPDTRPTPIRCLCTVFGSPSTDS